MTPFRRTLASLDEAMDAIELHGEVAPVAELVVAGVIQRLARDELDPRTAAAIDGRMRALIHRASQGDIAAADELWAHLRVLRERVACRIGREMVGVA
jgi:hypothetical protein